MTAIGSSRISGRGDGTVTPSEDRLRSSWVGRVLLLIGLCLVAWFYVWTVRSSTGEWYFGREQRDYYNFLVDGWLDGHLSMKVDVPDALLKIENPYDPAQRPEGLGLHDTSFYRGKYYLYFGIAPAVVAMLPFRLITGIDLPLPVTIVLFAYVGFLASAASFLALRRRYFPSAGILVSSLCVCALGIAGLGPVLIRRPEVWELPIASGFCFFMLTLRCLFGALHSDRARWQAGASLCLGLAIASRPTYIVALPLLLIPLLVRWRSTGLGRTINRIGGWRSVFATALPLVVIGLSLAWHNYARFGDPLEFGQKYQLSSMYESKLVHFSPRYARLNAWLYFVAPAQLTEYFPFIRGIANPAVPEGYGGFADVYGVFSNLPLAWFALLAPFALRGRAVDERMRLGGWLFIVAGAFLGIVALVLCFFGAHARYMLDFTPTLMVLAVVGLLVVERALMCIRRPIRWVFRSLWVGAAAYSIGFGVLFSLTATNEFHARRPELYEQVGRKLNYVAWWTERLLGVKHGPVELTVQFVPTPGRREALLTTGEGSSIDTVFVEYLADSRMRFGVLHADGPEQIGRPLLVDASAPHRIWISMGSLFPPANHPLYGNVVPEVQTRWTGRVVITCDDKIVLESPQPFYAAGLRGGRVGTQGDARAAPFSGHVINVRRFNVRPSDFVSPATESVRLRLRWPSETQLRQPLVSLGATGVLYGRHDDSGFHVGWMNSRGEIVESESFVLPWGDIHEFIVARPTAVGESSVRPRAQLQIVIDGETVWSMPATLQSDSVDLVVGKNTVNIAGCAPEFAGEILEQSRFVEGRDPLANGTGALHLRFRLPRNQDSGRDPLVVMGRAGAGDFLTLEYVNGQTVRFGFDHWGERMVQSDPVLVAVGVVHDVEVSLGSLERPAPHGSLTDTGKLTVTLDGRVVWSQAVSYYWPAPGEIYVGENPLGGSSCRARFSGEVLRADRIPTRSAPAR